MDEYVDEYVRIIKKAKENDKKMFDEFENIFRRDPYKKYYQKIEEEIYLIDDYENARVLLKTVPILSMIEYKDEFVTMTSCGKRNIDPKTKLISEKSKYVFHQAFSYLDEAIKYVSNNKQNKWGKETMINNDYYKYEILNKTDKYEGFVVNKDNLIESYYLIILFIIGKINEIGYFIKYDKEVTTFYIVHEYKILSEDKYKLIDDEIKQV
jgi:hypothetical protein